MYLSDFLDIVGNSDLHTVTMEFEPFGKNLVECTKESRTGFAQAIYNTITHEVFQATISKTGSDEEFYTWVDPEFVEAWQKYHELQGVDVLSKDEPHITATEDDILEKVAAILNNRSYDKRVVIQFELDSETLEAIQNNAINSNVTIDEYIETSLKEYIKEIENKVISE